MGVAQFQRLFKNRFLGLLLTLEVKLLMPPVGRRLIEEAYEIHRSKGLEVRLSLTLALSAMQVTVRFSSANFPKWTIDGETTYPHLHNLGMELNAREIFFSPLH
ncbi:hypothetical protein TNCV_3189281 [Trichonephila clavipes]|nr:hypothetical protein TNCV_3189281 [Trichonephila clavipes]